MTLQLRDFFRFYKQLPHQDAALAELQEAIADFAPALLQRDASWYKTWQAGGKQGDHDAAIRLIAEFEGCHLEAYPDPLSGDEPWTIGYGTTRYPDGRKVKRGDKVNVIEARQLLVQEVDRIAAQLADAVPHWGEMSVGQQGALLSFAYNLGSGFYGASGFETISRRLREKDWAQVPAALLLYRNPGSNVEAGLRRRREAEGKLWSGGQPAKPAAPAPAAKLTPGAAFSFKVTPHVTYGELCNDEQARRFLTQGQCDIAIELCQFLEKVRAHFNAPVIITSGHRPPAINAAVGGASNSEHLYKPGCGAVDFYVADTDTYVVQDWCDEQWPYSLGYGAPKGFVHLGIRDGRPRVRWDY
jgi:GH24 family phage-related lysozyme (muramidase)